MSLTPLVFLPSTTSKKQTNNAEKEESCTISEFYKSIVSRKSDFKDENSPIKSKDKFRLYKEKNYFGRPKSKEHQEALLSDIHHEAIETQNSTLKSIYFNPLPFVPVEKEPKKEHVIPENETKSSVLIEEDSLDRKPSYCIADILDEEPLRPKILVPSSQFGIKPDNMGYQILKKLGWNPNKGLGKNEQGTLYPIKVNIQRSKSIGGPKLLPKQKTIKEKGMGSSKKQLKKQVKEDSLQRSKMLSYMKSE